MKKQRYLKVIQMPRAQWPQLTTGSAFADTAILIGGPESNSKHKSPRHEGIPDTKASQHRWRNSHMTDG